MTRLPLRLHTVYRRAAELVAERRVGSDPTKPQYSCDAILQAASGRCPNALLLWRHDFAPELTSPEHYWLRGTGMTEVEKHEWRILALLLASEIARNP